MNKEKIKRFDFAKKPNKPCFLFGVAKTILCRPALRIRNFTYTKNGMEEVTGPYLLLVTHSSMVDFHIMAMMTHPHPVNNVMTLEGFKDYTEILMRSLGVLGTRKFISDIHLIKNIKYCIDKLGDVFSLFPEARYSLDGCTSYLPESVGKMVKVLKVPVVVLRIHGNFVTNPQWNKINKWTHVEAEMERILLPEEIKEMTAEEINTRIAERFVYDDFAWQRDNKIKIDHKKRANGLHSLLYKCCECGTESQMHSEGEHLWCEACGKKWYMTEYGQLEALEGETRFSHIPDWSNWERECVRKEIEEGTYYFEDDVEVETLPGCFKFYKQGKGKFIQTPEGTKLTCTCYGEPFTLERGAKNLESMHIEYDYQGRGDCIDISIPDDSFWCYMSKRDVITKISFATEEIHKYAMGKSIGVQE